MADLEKVITGLELCTNISPDGCLMLCPYKDEKDETYSGFCEQVLKQDALALLKEQEERLRKLQKDKDKLCLEVSEWKHKFHDAPPKFVSQRVVDQIRWERDTALSQLEQIGKGFGSKMDDIVALLKEQEPVKPIEGDPVTQGFKYLCGKCHWKIVRNYTYCHHCGKEVKWE